MDPLTYMFLSKTTGNIMYDIILLIVIIPVFSILINKFKLYIEEFIDNFNKFSKYKSLEFIGWENVNNGIYNFDFPFPMMAICYCLVKNNKASNVRFFNKSMNGATRWDPIIHNKEMHYIISSFQKIKFDKNIDIIFNNSRVDKNDKSDCLIWKISMVLSSKEGVDNITEFVNKCIAEYDNYLNEINKNKLYHFIFQGKDIKDEKYLWKTSILSDLSDDNNKNFESFNNIFSVNKNQIINDVKRLKDISYYKETGAKRKKGYLFYGPPGCGKTSTVIAIANYDKRHIIEIPMSRIKTNSDIEEILNLESIDGIKFKKEEIILLFDEIDTGIDVIQSRKSEKNNKHKNSSDVKDTVLKSLLNKDSEPYPKDKICLGSILSRLDGVGSYNGIIIIATTNCIDELSPAIYRHGRLNPILFDYMRKEDIKEMIENYFKLKLTEEQVYRLPDKTNKIAPSSLLYYMESNINNIDNLIEKLENI